MWKLEVSGARATRMQITASPTLTPVDGEMSDLHDLIDLPLQ